MISLTQLSSHEVPILFKKKRLIIQDFAIFKLTPGQCGFPARFFRSHLAAEPACG